MFSPLTLRFHGTNGTNKEVMTVERKQWLLGAALVLTLALSCVLAAALLLFLSTAPYELVLRVSRLATGSQNPLSHAQYSVLIRRTLPAGLFYGALGLGLLIFRQRLVSRTALALGSLERCLAFNRQAFAQACREESSWHL